MQVPDQLPFSFEQRDFWKSPARNAGEAMSLKIGVGTETKFVTELHRRYEFTTLYDYMNVVANEFDDYYGRQYDMGQSMMDGVVVGINAIDRYTPYLILPLESLIEDHVNEVYQNSYPHRKADGIYTDTQQARFIKYFAHPNGGYGPTFSPDFRPLVSRIAVQLHEEGYQRQTMMAGFEFVMLNAEAAYVADIKNMKSVAAHAARGEAILRATELDLDLEILLAEKERYLSD
jgi:hypothetical protein